LFIALVRRRVVVEEQVLLQANGFRMTMLSVEDADLHDDDQGARWRHFKS
jgi:hypothetical protein